MDRLLRPGKLEVLPEEPEATRIFDHWLKTFDTFLEAVRTAAENADNVNKLGLLTNLLTHQTFAFIADSATYEEARETLNNAYHRRKNIVFARHLLMTRTQKPSENINEYVHALRQLARDCAFQNVTAEIYKDELTRDAFISGISSSVIRQRLLEDTNLDFQTAVKKAQMLEQAERQSGSYLVNTQQAAALNSKSNSFDHLMQASAIKPISINHSVKRKCFFCGGSLHAGGRNFCPAKNKICTKCGKIGHFHRVCRSTERKATALSMATSSNTKASDGAHYSEDEKPSKSTTYLYSVLATAPSSLNSTTLVSKINGLKVDCLLDTGASNNFMSTTIAKAAKLQPSGKPAEVSMASNGLTAKVLGTVHSDMKVQGRDYKNIKFGVVPQLCADIILGQDFLCKHEEVVLKLGGPQESLVIGVDSCCNVSATTMETPRLFRNLETTSKLVATKSRKFNNEDKEFIQEEVRKLLSDNIIEPSFSPWRAQVLVARDGRHKPRMVVDYSQTINRYTLLDAYPLPNINEQICEIAKGSVFSTLDLKSAYYQIPLCPADRPFTAFEANGKLYQYTRLPFGVTNGVSCFQRIVDNVIEKYKLSGTYAYVDNITVCGYDKNDHDNKLNALFSAAKKECLTFNESKCVFARTEIDLLGYRISHQKIKPDPERLKPLLELPLPKTKSDLQRALGMFSYYAKWIKNFSDKIRPLVQSNITSSFPLSSDAAKSFELLRQNLASSCLTSVKEGIPFVVECDASDHTLAATLNQGGQPVAFHSRTFSNCEIRYSTVKKEAAAIIDAVRKWSHLLHGRKFTLLTDQRAVSFMLDPKRLGKIKNTKIQLWRAELGNFDYDILHRPGKNNLAPDALSRACVSIYSTPDLFDIHQKLGHPGISRLSHFVRTKNLPFSLEDVKSTCLKCKICAEQKPRFYRKPQETLIKATKPWERISVDFKGPLSGKNTYMFLVVDEFSRYPFAFACSNMTSSTVIHCLGQLFCLFGHPQYVHSDRGSSFMSHDLKKYLSDRGIASSKSSPYHPTGNSQWERVN